MFERGCGCCATPLGTLDHHSVVRELHSSKSFTENDDPWLPTCRRQLVCPGCLQGAVIWSARASCMHAATYATETLTHGALQKYVLWKIWLLLKSSPHHMVRIERLKAFTCLHAAYGESRSSLLLSALNPASASV